jgi:hypothetical protein
MRGSAHSQHVQSCQNILFWRGESRVGGHQKEFSATGGERQILQVPRTARDQDWVE